MGRGASARESNYKVRPCNSVVIASPKRTCGERSRTSRDAEIYLQDPFL